MRDLIAIVENYGRAEDPSWDWDGDPRKWPHEQCLYYAAGSFGNCDDGSITPEQAVWTCEDFPMVELLRPHHVDHSGDRQSWIDWLAEETKDSVEDGRGGYDYLVRETIQEPVVFTIKEGRPMIWDGWHRIAATFVKGDPTILAVVGRPR